VDERARLINELRVAWRARPAVAPAPVIKWVGGKTKLLPELVARMPVRFGRYFEPFIGGGALFFHVAPNRATLGDSNPDLINLYSCLARDATALVPRLEEHKAKHCQMHYLAVRALWNDPSWRWAPVGRAAAFIYLNKTCFNGLWRVNQSGQFNVPIGDYKDPPICVPAALQAAGLALAQAKLLNADYATTVVEAGKGDFLYFDPPYDPVSQTANFTGYTAGSFDRDDQAKLADLARELVSRGCRVMLSNSDTLLIRSLYRDFRIDSVQAGRSINSDTAKRGKVAELIIMDGY